MTTVIAAKTFSDGVLSMYEGERRRIDDAVATAYIAAGLVTEYTGDVTPEGIKEITTNGLHDVYGYASAQVDVPNPSTGTLEITENGTYDVTDKASAAVNVSGGGSDAVFRGLFINQSLTTEESGGVNYAEFDFASPLYEELSTPTAVDVIIDGVAYNDVVSRVADNYYEYGAPMVGDVYDFSEYPFCFRLLDGGGEAGIATEAAGTYEISVYGKVVYKGATVTVINNTDDMLLFSDLNFGTESTIIMPSTTQTIQVAVANDMLAYTVYGTDGAVTLTVTGDVTWDASESYGMVHGDGTITVS